MSTKEDKQYFKTGVVGFVFMYSVLKFGHYFNNNRKTKNQIKKLKSYPIKNVSEVVKEAQNQTKSNICFIEGIPQQGSLHSTFKKIPVILRIQQRTSLFSCDSFLEPRIKFDWKEASVSSDYQIDKPPYFALKDKLTQNEAHVSIRDDTDVSAALMSFGFKDEKRSLSFAEHIGNYATIFYSSIFRVFGPIALTQVLFRDSSFKGVHIGYRDNEFGIKADGLLSVLGQAVYNTDTKKITIENPLALTLSKNNYIYQLEKKLQENGVAINFWLVLTFLSGLYVSRRIYLYNKKHPKILQKVIAFIKKHVLRRGQNIEGDAAINQIAKPQENLPDEKKAQANETATAFQ
ncbi:unnamed protein product (macronuclear) [Paramecium tetraurelia]|uniref:RING-type E3 ubiquitin transferase n=1 Tax=Paramecium tetraurelia TaxID=5888 RepID=A0E3G0_PARTE|nr:uncharacterized protein GSPATT00023000001 [Paramecium tetraurelia]CAK89827.1 unnamed protein product [Paramecium tetraurelia]|eukprot:XP_001457224.1 hypothetical protein (macronuclear) [Paramecium tetraurelia strain d4-2]